MRPKTSFVLSAEEEAQIERIANELADPLLANERRITLTQEVAEIADRYRCDLRFAYD